jgi:hypothetical protein
VYTYEKNGKSLKFIAAKHENSIESATFKTILASVDSFRPQLMVLEGFEAKDDASAQKAIERAKRCKSENYKSCGDPQYGINLALEYGIPFVSGEPSYETILSYLEKQGYSIEDWIGFYTFRYVPQWKRQGTLKEGTLEKRIENASGEIISAMLLQEEFPYPRAVSWYERRAGKKFNPEAIVGDDYAPLNTPSANYFQRMNYDAGMATNRNLLHVMKLA